MTEPDALAHFRKVIDDAFPSNWLDPLLTGPEAVICPPHLSCPQVEALLHAVKARVLAGLEAAGVPRNQKEEEDLARRDRTGSPHDSSPPHRSDGDTSTHRSPLDFGADDTDNGR
jgi:hypothetical protein